MKAIGLGLLAFCLSSIILLMIVYLIVSDEPDEIIAASKLNIIFSTLIGFAVTLITWGS